MYVHLVVFVSLKITVQWLILWPNGTPPRVRQNGAYQRVVLAELSTKLTVQEV